MVVCDLRHAGGIGVWFCVAVHYSALVRLAGLAGDSLGGLGDVLFLDWSCEAETANDMCCISRVCCNSTLRCCAVQNDTQA